VSTEDRTPHRVRCRPCGHVWIGFYLPLAIKDATKIMGKLTCPMCAAGADKIYGFAEEPNV